MRSSRPGLANRCPHGRGYRGDTQVHRRGPEDCQQVLRGDEVKVSSDAQPGPDTAGRDKPQTTQLQTPSADLGWTPKALKSIEDLEHGARGPPVLTSLPIHAENHPGKDQRRKPKS